MSLYYGFKKFEKKILLLSGLILALQGCNSKIENYSTSQIFKDLNNDGKLEYIYMINTGKDEDKTGNANGYQWIDYELKIKDGKGEAQFDKPRVIQRFPIKPKEIKFKDITGDNLIDITYLISTGKDEDKTGNANGYQWIDYELKLLKNKGNNTFEKPKTIQRYPMKPSKLN